MIFPVLCCVFF